MPITRIFEGVCQKELDKKSLRGAKKSTGCGIKEPTLTNLIRNAVKESGLSQYELARRCKFSNKVVGRLLRGTDIRLGTADEILKAIKLKVKLAPVEKSNRQ